MDRLTRQLTMLRPDVLRPDVLRPDVLRPEDAVAALHAFGELLERQAADIDRVGGDSPDMVLGTAATVRGPATDFGELGHQGEQLLPEHFGESGYTG